MPHAALAPASLPTEAVDASLRLLRTIQMFLRGSIVLYAVMGEFAGPREPRDVKQMQMILLMLGLGLVAAIVIVRQRMVRPAEDALRAQPEDAAALGRWRAGNIVTFALAEAVALYGLLLRMLGARLQDAVPFYAAAAVFLVVLGPRRPE